jgi:hypothetical protein
MVCTRPLPFGSGITLPVSSIVADMSLGREIVVRTPILR